MTKQIMDTLHTLNKNTVNLGDSLMRVGLGGDTVQKTMMDSGQEEVARKESRD